MEKVRHLQELANSRGWGLLVEELDRRVAIIVADLLAGDNGENPISKVLADEKRKGFISAYSVVKGIPEELVKYILDEDGSNEHDSKRDGQGNSG